MKKYLIVILTILAIFVISILVLIISIPIGYEKSSDLTYQRSLNNTKVKAFHERFHNVTHYSMDLNKVIYVETDDNGYEM